MYQRNGVLKNSPPVLGAIAIFLLLFKLPYVAEAFGFTECATCTSKDPYLPMIGAAYFAWISALALAFPSFPSRTLVYAGIVFSVGLFIFLTYLSPDFCIVCFLAHMCHIAMWILWYFKPAIPFVKDWMSLRVCVVCLAPITLLALFSTLNLTFLVYGLKPPQIVESLISEGSEVNAFHLESGNTSISKEGLANYEAVILNFVSPQCPFCKEQLPRLDLLAQQYPQAKLRVVNVGPGFDPSFKELAPHLDWMPDPENKLTSVFGVKGHPTLVMLDNKGKVLHTSKGIPNNFEEKLKRNIEKILS